MRALPGPLFQVHCSHLSSGCPQARLPTRTGRICHATSASSVSFSDTTLAAAAPGRDTGSAASASSTWTPAPSAGNGTPSPMILAAVLSRNSKSCIFRRAISNFFGYKTYVHFFSCIYYTIQVHWCAALFCCTTPEQTKILQNRPSPRVFDGLGESSGGRNPPIPILGPENLKKIGISVENNL